MKKLSGITITLAFIVLIVSVPLLAHAEWVYVTRVVDGDTFVTADGTKIRIRGIDTPETKHPTKGKETGGEAATQLAKFFLECNYVWIEGTAKDKYGRRLATVKVAGGTSYADIVKQHGYDKNSNSIYAHSGSYRYNLSMPNYKPKAARTTASTYLAGATWVNGYFRSDGTWVSGHWKSNQTVTAPSYTAPKSPTYTTPASASHSGGDVQVKGYYRKDGTYVRPHTRSKPRR